MAGLGELVALTLRLPQIELVGAGIFWIVRQLRFRPGPGLAGTESQCLNSIGDGCELRPTPP